MSRSGIAPGALRYRLIVYLLETKSMFKKLVPVIALAVIAAPAFAADEPAPAK